MLQDLNEIRFPYSTKRKITLPDAASKKRLGERVDGQNRTIFDVAAAEGVEASEVSRIHKTGPQSPCEAADLSIESTATLN